MCGYFHRTYKGSESREHTVFSYPLTVLALRKVEGYCARNGKLPHISVSGGVVSALHATASCASTPHTCIVFSIPNVEKRKKLTYEILLTRRRRKNLCYPILLICGPGGGRTLVQTGKSYAFYTLITVLIFVRWQDRCHQPVPYPLNFHQNREADFDYPRFFCTTLSRHFGARVLGWCLVPTPCIGIKPYLLCFNQAARAKLFSPVKLSKAEI